VSDSLFELALSNCAITKSNGLLKILKSAPNLESLDISENPALEINKEFADSLSEHQTRLRTLLLNGCSVSLVSTPILNLEQLVRLDLSSTLKKEEGDLFISTVLRHSNLPQLEALLFDNNSLTSAGLQELFSL
jgi:Leucine-rich repeat (LRR) protein